MFVYVSSTGTDNMLMACRKAKGRNWKKMGQNASFGNNLEMVTFSEIHGL